MPVPEKEIDVGKELQRLEKQLNQAGFRSVDMCWWYWELARWFCGGVRFAWKHREEDHTTIHGAPAAYYSLCVSYLRCIWERLWCWRTLRRPNRPKAVTEYHLIPALLGACQSDSEGRGGGFWSCLFCLPVAASLMLQSRRRSCKNEMNWHNKRLARYSRFDPTCDMLHSMNAAQKCTETIWKSIVQVTISAQLEELSVSWLLTVLTCSVGTIFERICRPPFQRNRCIWNYLVSRGSFSFSVRPQQPHTQTQDIL